MKIASDMTQLIGHTPLLALDRFSAACGAKAQIVAKLEFFNPAGSVKDRPALRMIERAEQEGKIGRGATLVEPTSGNTGIGLAAVAAMKGYRLILTMPDSMSVERRNLLAAYGAELVLTPASLGMNGAVARAEEIAREIPRAWIPGQFDNADNPKAHYDTTGPEIWTDTEGELAAFVAGIGTGGTFSGTAKALKERNPKIFCAAAEPSASPLLAGGTAGSHKIQGIGANFVPKNFDPTLCDEVIGVSDDAAFAMCRLAVKTEGILIGISGGAALAAAAVLAKRPAFAGRRIVTVIPDGGSKYLSTGVYTQGVKI